MPTEPEPDLAPEIAHVLLMDVVGYSKLLVDDQIRLLRRLNQIVRSTPHFLAAEKDGKLTRLPTGDGMALLFFDSPETPLRCALEISEGVRQQGDINLRMGIHSGPIREVADVNDRVNVAGAGIDTAQRVLDCGDAGHILVSKRAADDLNPYRHWHDCLQDLGECEVKHGVRLHLFNLCKDGLGNSALPAKIRQQHRQPSHWLAATGHWVGGSVWRRVALLAAFLLVLLIAGGGGWLAWQKTHSDSAATRAIPEKSIAVLPFINLSDDKQNAYFADGVQDEILTHLARIADLKVISRTSVMQYGSGPQHDIKAIGRALGVAHILEGSVQRVSDRVRIVVQLIDSRNDVHLWAEHYDRDLSDVFAIQTEVAESVASHLKARLSSQEKAAIEERPTENLEAYEYYVRGKTLVATSTFNSRGNEDLVAATRLFDRAVAKDPQFFLAYYQLASAHNQLYLFGVDHTPARLQLADAAIKQMQLLRPNAGETHLALGEYLYWGFREYVRAREQLALAARALSNNSRPVLLAAYIDRREGRSTESLQGFYRALDLDPRNLTILQQISLSYQHLRRFADMAAVLDQALALAPDDVGTRVQRAAVDLEWKADRKPLRAAINSVLEKDRGAATNIADTWFYLALCERDPAEAERALAVMTREGCGNEGVLYPRAWCVGVAARIRGDEAAAAKAFGEAREEAAKIVHEQPDYAEGIGVLGMIDAALGRKEEALQEGRKAVELLPVSQDSIDGSILMENLALIYAWTGEKDEAIKQLAATVQIPGQTSYGSLRLHPYWDPLRGDPRFEQIVESLAPKDR